MKLNAPICITSRLRPGVRIPGDGSLTEISIHIEDTTPQGRQVYRYHIDGPNFEHTNNDLKSGCGNGDLQAGLASLLSFLSAAAESYAYRLRTGRQGENEDLFPPAVVQWAYQHSDEIALLTIELEENTNLIED